MNRLLTESMGGVAAFIHLDTSLQVPLAIHHCHRRGPSNPNDRPTPTRVSGSANVTASVILSFTISSFFPAFCRFVFLQGIAFRIVC